MAIAYTPSEREERKELFVGGLLCTGVGLLVSAVFLLLVCLSWLLEVNVLELRLDTVPIKACLPKRRRDYRALLGEQGNHLWVYNGEFDGENSIERGHIFNLQCEG